MDDLTNMAAIPTNSTVVYLWHTVPLQLIYGEIIKNTWAYNISLYYSEDYRLQLLININVVLRFKKLYCGAGQIEQRIEKSSA